MIVRKGERLGSVLADKTSTEPAPQPAPRPEPAPTPEPTPTPVVTAGPEPQRPPTSGPGSGVEAWRRYAADVTDSPLESWSSLTRDEIIELLDSEGVGHGT